jgi:hypothetical protein
MSSFLRTAYLDAPWEEPELLRACVTDPLVSRAYSALVAARPQPGWTSGRDGLTVEAVSAPLDTRP